MLSSVGFFFETIRYVNCSLKTERVKNMQIAIIQPLPTFHSLTPQEQSVGKKSLSRFFFFFFGKGTNLTFLPLTSQGSTIKVVSLRRECSPLLSSHAPSSSKHKFSRSLGSVVPILGGGQVWEFRGLIK